MTSGGAIQRRAATPDGAGTRPCGCGSLQRTVREPWMRVVVDLNRCQAYAQCCYAAPGAFEEAAGAAQQAAHGAGGRAFAHAVVTPAVKSLTFP